MKIIRSESDHPEDVSRGIALGFFDGMHRGHLQLIRTLASLSASKGVRSCVYTFDRHPSELISGRARPEGYLNSRDDRLAQIRKAGIEETYLQHFDQTLAEMSEDDFLDFLNEKLHAALIVIGYDFRFGKKRKGDAETIREWGAGHGIEVVVVDAFSIGGVAASSTAIRRFISNGDMESAAGLLGRDFSIRGAVEKGRRIGTKLGFPTANITVPEGQVVPATGVYATRTRLDGVSYESITNVGTRPTIDKTSTKLVVESYLLHVDKNLYGKEIEVSFLSRIRGEMRFGSLLQLSTQISEDILNVRAWHLHNEHLWLAADVKGILLYQLRTDRFRTSILTVNFRMPLTRHTATAGNLLLRIMGNCCRRIPDRRKLSIELDRLFGARIETNVDREGDSAVLSFYVDSVTRWTDQTQIFSEASKLLMDMILEPLLDDQGRFPADMVETERAGYVDELQARWNDRDRYAIEQGIEWYLDGTPHGVDAAGDLETLRALDGDDLVALYRDMMEQASIMIVLGGDNEPAYREWLIGRISDFPETTRSAPSMPGLRPGPVRIPDGHRTKTERKPLEQTRIVKVYTGLPSYFSPDSMAVNVLNSMFGAHPHSLLFENVREKQGLAYSIFSTILRFVHGMVVYAGITADSVQQVLDTTDSQLRMLASGENDPALFDRAVVMVRNQLLSLRDSLGSLLSFYSAGIVNGRLFYIREALALLDEVTPIQVRNLAGRLQPASLYLLTSDEEDKA